MPHTRLTRFNGFCVPDTEFIRWSFTPENIREPNYLRKQSQFPDLPQGLQLNDFVVKFILSKIGRKELEEFGIVNIPANLNKFQKGKRNLFKTSVAQEPWHIIQNCAKEILTDGEKHLAESALHSWFDADVPSAAGLYSVSNEGIGLIYIGESSDIFERYRTHSRDTYFSALRRHIGEDILGFKLQVRKGKRRYFSDDENLAVTDYLKTCSISFMPIQFGRFEFEEYLIRKYRPFLNRKENR